MEPGIRVEHVPVAVDAKQGAHVTLHLVARAAEKVSRARKGAPARRPDRELHPRNCRTPSSH